jgi:hypothetical protein
MGGLTLLLAIGSALGLLLTMIGCTWFRVSDENALVGFFGFGIPMALAAVGTAFLWAEEQFPLSVLGWAGSVVAVIFGVCLLILVAGWVMRDNDGTPPAPTASGSMAQKSPPGVYHCLGFGIPMLGCGIFGILVLVDPEGKRLI